MHVMGLMESTLHTIRANADKICVCAVASLAVYTVLICKMAMMERMETRTR